jgi:hypothetical protein
MFSTTNSDSNIPRPHGAVATGVTLLDGETSDDVLRHFPRRDSNSDRGCDPAVGGQLVVPMTGSLRILTVVWPGVPAWKACGIQPKPRAAFPNWALGRINHGTCEVKSCLLGMIPEP